MKRLRSSDDLESYNEKSSSNPNRSSSSSRSFYYKSENARKGLGASPSSTSSRYDRDNRSIDDDGSRESSRLLRKRSDLDFDSGFDRSRKGSGSGLGLGFDRYGGREGYGGGGSESSRSMHRSESFCGSRREFPKGFRSERERSRREGSVSSWSSRRFAKEFEENSSSGSRGGGGGGGVGGVNRGGGNEERVSASGGGVNRGGGNEERVSGGGVVSRASPRGLRDVKSPTWSRDSGRGGSSGREEDGKRGKRANSQPRASPTWSKESESEQSKSEEAGKKSGDVEVKSVETEVEKRVETGSSSEMEEGELEPEPELVARVVKGSGKVDEKEEEGRGDVEMAVGRGEIEGENQVKDRVSEEEMETRKASDPEGNDTVVKEVDEMPNDEENVKDKTSGSEEEVGNVGGTEGDREGDSFERVEQMEVESKDQIVEKLVNLEQESRQGKGIDLEMKIEDDEATESLKEVAEENGQPGVNTDMVTESLGQNLKDKGKGVAISLTHVADSAGDRSMWIERESRNIATFRDGEDDTEGPSTRGFELFTSSPVRRAEKAEQSGASKQKDEKLMLEPLDLSLSLPNVLLPIGATKDTTQAPGSPSHGRSVHSFSTFCTNSDGFTQSVSFSGSQSFFHNPSCSLTHNSLDMDNFEQSVHSRPIFQGVDWQGQAQNDSKNNDVPLYQRMLMNGNGSHRQSQQGMSNGQAPQGSSKDLNGLERQLSFHRQLSGKARNHDDTRSPAQSVGSHDMGSNYSLEKKRAVREKHGSSLYRSNSHKEQEQFLIGGPDFVENIIGRIVSEPIHVMARKFHEMAEQSASCLKESIREIMSNADKQGQLCAFQGVLHNRSDLTLDILLKCHRAQLEILVALKTGLSEYLQVDNNISPSDLAEIFMNLRCRNISCRSLLPVDECDCKVCTRKNGFCSACMCLVCSKFDMATNTCSWVGCDVCLHWCHADCALRESYIRNGRSVTAAQKTSEMQFHCVACDHPSEMFGFVKEVFQNFAKEWTAETFCRELEYVKRIFCASKDVRGRRLHEIADQMLAKLANKSNLPEVHKHIMGFLADTDSSKFVNAPLFSGNEQGNESHGAIAGPSQDSWLKSTFSEKAAQLERSSSLLSSFHADLNDKHPVESELQRSAQKEPLFDELESIVRIKQAEAKMFQARADDARREAEGLKRIAIAKNEKIEEEYTSRIAKLRMVETEEIRKQKLEEFQALDRAHREYFSMKMRMEADIKDLLLKMEATKRNLAM